MKKNNGIKAPNDIRGKDVKGEAAKPSVEKVETEVPKPLLPGLIYGEIVFWFMITGLLIAIPTFIWYLHSGGLLASANLLDHLWAGSDVHTIWKEVGNSAEPAAWYQCFENLSHADMLAMVGVAVTAFAGIVGMWGAFVGTLRIKAGIFTVFALIIAAALTLSAVGIFKLE